MRYLIALGLLIGVAIGFAIPLPSHAVEVDHGFITPIVAKCQTLDDFLSYVKAQIARGGASVATKDLNAPLAHTYIKGHIGETWQAWGDKADQYVAFRIVGSHQGFVILAKGGCYLGYVRLGEETFDGLLNENEGT